MGKETGFLELDRQDRTYDDPAERVKHYREFVIPHTEPALRAQASRLDGAGLNPGPVEPASAASLVRLSDPDGNLVVLAQPGRV